MTDSKQFNIHVTNLKKAQLPNTISIEIGQQIEAKKEAFTQERALYKKGVKLYREGKAEEADIIFAEVLAKHPEHSEALHLQGVIALQCGRYDESIALLKKAIDVKPNYVEAYNNLGAALMNAKRYDESLACYQRALDINPQFAPAFTGIGCVLSRLGEYELALQNCNDSIKINPNIAETYCNRGVVYCNLNLHEAAVADFKKSILLNSNYADAYFNLSVAYLRLGHFDEGLPLFEWRWKVKALIAKQRKYDALLWLGDASLQGKTILLWSEQGLGDSIQFCRYATILADLGAKVILETPAPLITMMIGLKGVHQLSTVDAPAAQIDYHCPLMSLPLAFKLQLDTIPAKLPYLYSPKQKQLDWLDKLGKKTKPRLGIVWSGNPNHGNDINRSLSLSIFYQIFTDKVQLISLQKEFRPQDQTFVDQHPDILHFENEMNDFSDTAALCMAMDLVVCVDTSVAHLAAALGRPVWMLLPFFADWRWLLAREDTPWYPNIKLYRQPKLNDWDSVLERVKKDVLRIAF